HVGESDVVAADGHGHQGGVLVQCICLGRLVVVGVVRPVDIRLLGSGAGDGLRTTREVVVAGDDPRVGVVGPVAPVAFVVPTVVPVPIVTVVVVGLRVVVAGTLPVGVAVPEGHVPTSRRPLQRGAGLTPETRRALALP